jgi:GR25 family glycosyltransferase involved in LPS biosynthesis
MAINDGFIIYLPSYPISVEMANRAIQTGRENGWSLNLYEGVLGTANTLEQNNLYPIDHKKAKRLLARPGTQGCFLSQYNLWKMCVEINTPICIFEHDVIFKKPMGDYEDCDVYKFEGFNKAKPIPAGNWYEGARAYRITPLGASKIINWVHTNGVMPADWMLCDGIVDMRFDKYNKVTFKTNVSFTKDLS